jgi:hypothetical protein
MSRKRDRERRLETINLLALSPVRIAEWEEVDGRVTILRPLPRTHGLRGLLDRFLHLMSAHRIRLDEIGSFTWHRLDGRQTVGEIAQQLRREFGEVAEPAEQRLANLVWVLRREKLIAYPDWDESPGPGSH